MMWPFKKKDKLIKSTSGTLSNEYHKLRASVGMGPAGDDDCGEAIAWVVVFNLLAPEVADECKRLPTEERAVFMNSFACYLLLLAEKAVEENFPPNSWGLSIAPLIGREFSKQSWYQPEVMNRIYDSMIEHPPIAKSSGRYFKASLGPWFGAVTATNLAGYKLSHPWGPKFFLYVISMSTNILESIRKMAAS